MISFLGLFLPLLVPVAALLFLNLRLSRRLRYPHDFLEEERRRGPASFLFRSLRAHYDILIDGLIALVLTLALLDARPPDARSLGDRPPGDRAREKTAVIVDCSRSMLAGVPGSRPLDLALERIAKDEELRGRKAFALAFDPASMRTRLFDLQQLLRGRTGGTAAAILTSELSFFAVDYGELSSLRRRGFHDLLLLTDSLPGRPEGFRAVELGFAGGRKADSIAGGEAFGAYPSAARYDRLSDTYQLSLAETGALSPLELGIWNSGASAFDRLPLSRYSIEEGLGGRRIRLPGPGLYLVSLKGPYGQEGADFPIRIEQGRTSADASGEFSELLLAAFPLLEKAPRPRIVLLDLGSQIERGQSSGSLLVSAFSQEDGAFMLDPALSGGRAIAASFVPGADFGLGQSTLANEDLILAYDGAILARLPAAFSSSVPPGKVPPGTKRLLPAGSSFLALGPAGLTPLIPPASEYFEPSSSGLLRILPVFPSRPLWAAILGLLALAKLLLWKKLSGKPLFRSA